MSEKKKVTSIAITPSLHEDLVRYSKRRGMSTSSYVCELIEQAVKLNIDDDPLVIGKPVDEEVTPVVLKIPASYKSDPEELKKWLKVQMDGILRAVTQLEVD